MWVEFYSLDLQNLGGLFKFMEALEQCIRFINNFSLDVVEFNLNSVCKSSSKCTGELAHVKSDTFQNYLNRGQINLRRPRSLVATSHNQPSITWAENRSVCEQQTGLSLAIRVSDSWMCIGTHTRGMGYEAKSIRSAALFIYQINIYLAKYCPSDF